MTAQPEYRFTFQITDQTTGEVVENDWCTITDARIGENGECETVDREVGRMLRNWRRFARENYEHCIAPDEDEDAA
jgi:hypothetical protein